MTEHPLGYQPDTTEAPDTATRGPGLPLSIDDILATARRVERTATICLRADLVADREAALREIANLVDPNGKPLDDDDEAAVGEQSNAARAHDLNEQIKTLTREMAQSSWTIRFRAMDSDAWAVFTKAHLPQGNDADLTAFNTRLIATTAIEPALTIADVEKLRKALSPSQVTLLANTAWEACTTGGVDVPKSSSSWLRQPLL